MAGAADSFAEETKALIVGPYLIGEIEQQMIHMAGGTLHFKNHDGQRIAYDEHRLGDVHLSAVPGRFEDRPATS